VGEGQLRKKKKKKRNRICSGKERSSLKEKIKRNKRENRKKRNGKI
jgi:hypothetical protein